MSNNKQISSLQNPLIKKLRLLQDKSRERKKSGQFLLEGLREITLAIKGNYKLDTLFYVPKIISQESILNVQKASGDATELIEITKEIYQKIAYRGSTEGVIALVHSKTHKLEGLKINAKNPLILVAETPEKPGNIGALLRTADAANLDAVIIANPKSDIYNPNIIRSSVGCIFTNQIAVGSTEEVVAFLKSKKIDIYCAALSTSEIYTKTDFSNSTAIVVGTEASGLSDEWLNNSTKNIIIPMEGEIDSMNVSVAAAVVIFEAKRQRNTNENH